MAGIASPGGAFFVGNIPQTAQTLRAAQGGLGGYPSGEKGKVYELTVYAPDGTDPPGTGNLAANTTTVMAGPESAAFPLAPGARKTWYWVNPGDFQVAAPYGGSPGLFVTFGGTPRE